MSVTLDKLGEVAAPARYQPFECHVCQSRFTRHENLKRHSAVHARSGDEMSFPCPICQITFSRRDLRHRHMKRKHPDKVDSGTSVTLQHHAASAGPLRDEPGRRGSKTLSRSPSDRAYILQPGQPLNPRTLHAENWTGQMDFAQREQPQLEFDEQAHPAVSPGPVESPTSSTNYIDVGVAQDTANWMIQQRTVNEAGHMDTARRSTSSFGQSFSLEPSGVEPSPYLDSQMYVATGRRPLLSEGSSNIGSPRPYIPDGLSSRDISYLQDNWYPTPAQTARGYHLYFTHVSHFVPFLHRPTFDATEIARHLGLSMLCLAYQYGEDPDCGERAGSGAKLSLRCFHQARVLAASEEEIAGDLSHKIGLVQAYWLLQVCVMMYLCEEDAAYGLKLHSRMISLARFGGLTQPIPGESATTEDLEALWREFIKAESLKRTLLAVHQIDALWYQLFSIPRSLSHLEIKHDLPCREGCWTAVSSAQWAHRQLAVRQSVPLVPYSDAVRCFLSPEPDIESLPIFDLYGAINIAQFLLSSAREVSGWSTMTGRLSLERFEPLRASLIALERLIRPESEIAKSTHAATCEATWEMAMVELLIWSPSHTCGIVGGSVDSFLHQSTYLASSCSAPYASATNEAVRPHINWFLQYLDTTLVVDFEPPWIALYAYKAFLIAWQMVREGLPQVMQVVGVQDGDARGATLWAKKVFKRRQQRQLSKLILSYLDVLDG